MSSDHRTIMPPPPLVVLAGWAAPGAGYWLIGQRARGAVVGVTILLLFISGLLIGGMRVVDSTFMESVSERQDRESTEANPGYRRPNAVMRVLQKPWFIGQFFTGPVALASNWIGTTWGGKTGSPYSHARVYEIGVLYTAVAGMLNLMAIIDSAYRAANGGGR